MISAFHFIEKGSIVKKVEMIRDKENNDEKPDFFICFSWCGLFWTKLYFPKPALF